MIDNIKDMVGCCRVSINMKIQEGTILEGQKVSITRYVLYSNMKMFV